MFEGNFYFNPESRNCEIVAVLDEPNLSYEYATAIVLKEKESGKLYAAFDSGCSCPTPFENFRSLEDFTPINSEEDFNMFISGYRNFDNPDVFAARRKVREALK